MLQTTPPPPVNPLLAIMRGLKTRERKEEFATLAGTSVSYLYQLAGCYKGRNSCRTDLAKRISDASRVMARKYRTKVISMETLATMCQRCGE